MTFKSNGLLFPWEHMCTQLEGTWDGPHNKTLKSWIHWAGGSKKNSFSHFTPPYDFLHNSHAAYFLENGPDTKTKIMMFSKLHLLSLGIPAEFNQDSHPAYTWGTTVSQFSLFFPQCLKWTWSASFWKQMLGHLLSFTWVSIFAHWRGWIF